ncbi:MAG: MATE family efflux transporter [Hespellia sp.]|nr:MATE family efflux transporter [Hespellia sp.]
MTIQQNTNPLATAPVGKLIAKFAIPAIISMLVSALYNIVDQIFIGQGVGMLGNAATNVAFPVTTICTSIGLLLGIGGASNFNLESGAGEVKKAEEIAANAISSLINSGVIIAVVILVLIKPLLFLFGATDAVYPYAVDYTGITALGIPFLIFTTGGSHLIRADRSPKFSMFCTVVGAIINTILDPIFIFVFGWGIKGAAWATIIGQFVSALLVLFYFVKLKNMKLEMAMFRPRAQYLKMIARLGVAAFINQIAMLIVQIVMNNTLRYYGANSIYGSDIPLACVGVIMKVNMIFMAICIGISQGCQPIWGFNYGAENFERVRKTYKWSVTWCTGIAVVFFVCFQLFPRQIVSIFGTGSEVYFQFAERFFRINLFMTFANGIQPMSSGFFTSIGKAKLGIVTALTRQVLFLLPMLILFPILWGIDGVMYAAPIADFIALVLVVWFAARELKTMRIEQNKITLN